MLHYDNLHYKTKHVSLHNLLYKNKSSLWDTKPLLDGRIVYQRTHGRALLRRGMVHTAWCTCFSDRLHMHGMVTHTDID